MLVIANLRGYSLYVMAYTERPHPKEVPFTGFSYLKGRVGISQVEVC